MGERLRKLLADLHNPDLYVEVPDEPVFDAHEEVIDEPVLGHDGKPLRDPHGQVRTRKTVRRFDRRALEYIAQVCNRRDASGNLAPLTLGHTIPGQSGVPIREKDQPEPVGFAHGYRVRWDDTLKRYVIATNYYIRKERYQEARTYPRTSIELWPDSWEIDPIALIRRTPERDLGVWAYGRTGPDFPTSRSLCYARTDHSGRTRSVLRYTLEKDMPDMPLQTPSPPVPPPHPQAEQFVRHVMGHPYARELCDHYAAPMTPEVPAAATTPASAPPGSPEMPEQYGAGGPGFPGATDVSPPGTKEEDKLRMQRDTQAIQFARMERRLAEVEARAQRAETEAAQYARKARRSTNEGKLKQLLFEDYEIDVPRELDHMDTIDDAACDQHVQYLRVWRKQAPTSYGRPLLPIAADSPRQRQTTAEERDAAVRLATKRNVDYDTALAELRNGSGTAN